MASPRTPRPDPIRIPRGDIYGSATNADTLANTQIGGRNYPLGDGTSFRFRAGESAPLAAIGTYLEGGPGYSGGNGGTLEIAIQTDDGTAAHHPSGTVLAAMDFDPGAPISRRLGEREFASPPDLVAGVLYHVVFKNVARSPRSDFVSVNALYVDDENFDQLQPNRVDRDWAMLLHDGDGWKVRRGYTPILQLRYANGSVEGVGYIEVWSAEPRRISGSEAVRHTFVVDGRSRSATSVSVRVTRLSGEGALSVRLERADGTLVEQGNLLASEIGRSSWATLRFGAARVLREGQGYRLTLTALPDTVYQAVAIRKGTAYGFTPPTYFGDGHAEYTSGTEWRGFDQPGGRKDTREGDLQFYLE